MRILLIKIFILVLVIPIVSCCKVSKKTELKPKSDLKTIQKNVKETIIDLENDLNKAKEK
ncbi:MAG: hypothetical protein SNJ64_04045 [Endomicrobiia bacterium]